MKTEIEQLRGFVNKGNIICTGIKEAFGNKYINRYIGNGLLGACPGPLGTINDLSGEKSIVPSYVAHKTHYTSASYGMEFRVPLLTQFLDFVYAGKSLACGAISVEKYSQALDIFTAVLTSEYTLYDGNNELGNVAIAQWFDKKCKNEFRMTVRANMKEPVIMKYGIKPVVVFTSHYNYPYKGKASYEMINSHSCLRLDAAPSTTFCTLLWDELLEKPCEDNGGLAALCMLDGNMTVECGFVAVNDRDNIEASEAFALAHGTDCDQSLERHIEAWHGYWDKCVLGFESDYMLNEIWLRGMYYFGITEADFESIPTTPGGLSGSKSWPFYFPQDYSYIYPCYLITNHFELAGSVIRYWRKILNSVLDYTRDVLGTAGAFYPWSPPYYNFDLCHREGVPNKNYYELHNSAYVARMLSLFFEYTGDEVFLKNEAIDVINEIARFYSDISTLNNLTGKYEIVFVPNAGQDEFGGENGKNYLCVLQSSLYAIKTAVKYCRQIGLVYDSRWDDIIDRGYDFEKLVKDGMLTTFESTSFCFGKQKHPVQLNSAAFIPLPEITRRPEFMRTYEARYDITRGAKNNFWHGWTLGEFLVATVRVGGAANAEIDFRNLYETANCQHPCADKDFIQFFESSSEWNRTYFITVYGLICQAITELFIQDRDDVCHIMPVVLESMRRSAAFFRRLRSRQGFLVSGQFENGKLNLSIENEHAERLRIKLCEGGEYSLYSFEDKFIARSIKGIIDAPVVPGLEYTVRKDLE